MRVRCLRIAWVGAAASIVAGCPGAPRDVPPAPSASVAIVDGAPPRACTNEWRGELPSACSEVAAVGAASAGADASAAIDRDACTMWNANAPAPQEVTLDLGGERVVRGVIVVPAMTPSGAVAHVASTSTDGAAFTPRARFEGTMQNARAQMIAFVTPVSARYVRVRTERSPSWVAWFEIVPVACAGDAPPAASVEPPAASAPDAAAPAPSSSASRFVPPSRIVPGTGRCKVDSDCFGSACCSPLTCTSKRPACGDIACPTACLGPLDCGRGTCVCNRGTCAARVSEANGTFVCGVGPDGNVKMPRADGQCD